MGIQDEQGVWHNDPKLIEEVVLRYFRDIFTTSNPCRMDGIQQPTPMKVAKLLVWDRRAWNEEMVREMFEPEVATHILKILLSKILEPDKLIWCESELGQVLVKFAYFKARLVLDRDSNPLDQRNPM